MLKLEDISIKNEKGQLILQHVSFALPNFGIVAIHGDNASLHHGLAQVLAGIQKPESGALFYNDTEMRDFDEEERSRYRSIFVSSLFHDFQLLKTRSVYENITMGLEYPQERVEQELRKWSLFDKREISVEDLSTQEQWTLALIRVILRQPMMLVFDRESCPLSDLECKSFYTLLQELQSSMLIVVIGDQGCYPYAKRIIEIDDGHLLSDSIHEEEVVYPQINHSSDTFELTRADVDALHNDIHRFIRWKLRCASILCVVAFIALSTAAFSTTLNITDIQMRVMQKQGSSLIAIEKQAVGKDGEIIENYYDYLKKEDVNTLSTKLADELILGYYPADEKISQLHTYGGAVDKQDYKTLDKDTIIEADSEKELGIETMIGEYPQDYHQIALSSSQAYELLQGQLQEPYRNSEDQIAQMLNMHVLWYGNDLVISAIFPSYNSGNSNMDLDMMGYNGSTTTSSTIMENSFFVRKGFHEVYPILQMNVFQNSYKRMVAGSKMIGNMDAIFPLEENLLIYDGKEYHLSQKLKEDEILVDFSMALNMGYRNIYQQFKGVERQNYDSIQSTYKSFAQQWIHKEVNIQAYTVEDAPNTSSLMSKKVKIKGFVLPYISRNDELQDKQQTSGAIYVSPTLSAPYETQNNYIKEAFYHSKSAADSKKALNYLNGQEEYAAYLTNSRILKFFVVDLKEITSFLLLLGCGALLSFMAILCFLLAESCKYMRAECSVFYLFGARKSTLEKVIKSYFNIVLWMRSLFGWFCGTLALGIFILMIYFALFASSTILYALLLPLLLFIISMVSVRIVFYCIMKKTCVIETEFWDI